jgi:hypothetical protein
MFLIYSNRTLPKPADTTTIEIYIIISIIAKIKNDSKDAQLEKEEVEPRKTKRKLESSSK